MMWFLVNADFAMIYWSFMGRIPFTLCVTATSTAAQIYNLAYMGFILTAYILSCVEIPCVNVSICITQEGCYSTLTTAVPLKNGDIERKKTKREKKKEKQNHKDLKSHWKSIKVYICKCFVDVIHFFWVQSADSQWKVGWTPWVVRRRMGRR